MPPKLTEPQRIESLARKREYMWRYYRENQGKWTESSKRRRADPEFRVRQAVWNKKWTDKNPERVRTMRRSYKLRTGFGLTLEAYDEMLARQAGVCAICGVAAVDRDLNVDHDHATGQIRGLLCASCNLGIGNLKDDPARLRAAAAYLERS